jgi:putative SOS response-associated peptidase YedK
MLNTMCGRFVRNYTTESIRELYQVLPGPNFQPRFNICPTDTIDTIVARNGQHELLPMRWGLVPAWWKKPLKEANKLATFNARVETVTEKPFFRGAFRRNRCLIPASGYYEWQAMPKGQKPQPHYFTARDSSPILTIAGLWDEWKNPETGEPIKSCAMIICEPNRFVAEVHDRMPVLLEPSLFDPWLDGRAGSEILVPAANTKLQRWAVSTRINSSRADADDATLSAPLQ